MNDARGGDLTLGSFVEGPSNRLALAAVRRVAAGAGGVEANPLVIVAPRGLGKSHLLAALRNEAGAQRHVEAETVTGLAERAHGERGGVVPLHECDLLLLDGLEVIAGRPDLAPLVQDLVESRVPFGRLLVVTTELPPAQLGAESLAHALTAGLVVEMSEPDPGTRLGILRRRAADLSPALPDEVLTAVASLPFASIRELLAALQRLAAFQAVSPAPLDPEQARILIGGIAASSAEPVERPATATDGPEEVTEPPPALDDEFGSFLSEVVASVGQQMDRWRADLGTAVLRYGGEGYRTHRLEALLERSHAGGVAEAIADFEGDIARLRAIEEEAVALLPELAGSPAFRDPDRMPEVEALLWQARRHRDPLPAPSPTLRFEAIGEGPGNRHAVQAARAVAQAPGQKYNPLVIVGPSGTGKSHLLHAIGNTLLEHGVDGVACLTGEVLLAEHQGGAPEWRSRYRFAGALLVDDLHALAGHAEAQAELLELFVHCLEGDRQVVFTAGEPLAALAGIDPRLLTRLEAGLVVDLARPDRDVRRAVVRQLLTGTTAEGDAALADWLADRPADSVRAVQGMVRRVLSVAEGQGVTPSPALAREVLERRAVAGVEPRRSGSHRGPGQPGPSASLARSPEKMVQEWPRLAERLLEEFG
ncbi:MAG TPA: DnaA/Hda family protein [Gemmatimonadales bacterium]|nr:DnaA/Hda family protein [Gemmatimonadales bacterium]